MSYETQLTQLINETSQLINEVSGKFQQWDNKVNQARQQVDGFIANARGEYPALNLYKNPLFKGTAGTDFAFGGWNPEGHSFTYEAVDWNYNNITRQMAEQIGTLDENGDPKCCSLITEAGIKFLKVNMQKKPGTDGYFLMSGVNPRPSIHWGMYTAIISIFGVGQGKVLVSPAGELQTGDVVKNGLITHQILNGWHHVDTFTIYLKSDVVEFYIGLPVLVPGYIEDGFKALIAEMNI